MAKSINQFLPTEMIFKILSFLPVISLLRCKSVCRSWLSIITNPQFIQTHLTISNTQHPSLDNLAYLLCFNAMVRDQPESVPLAFLGSHENSSCIQLPPQIHARTRSRFIGYQFFGYCNGLVCIADYCSHMLYVWNPSIKRFKMLPTPNLITKTTRVKLGFGYDSVCDDYKVVRILV